MPSGAMRSGQVREGGRLGSGGVEDQDVFEGVGEVVLAADDVADAEVGIVGAGGEVIGGHAVAAEEGEVLDVGVGFGLLAVDGVVEVDGPMRSRGTRKRRTKGSPAAARRSLSSRESSRMPGLKSQVPWAPDFSLSPP